MNEFEQLLNYIKNIYSDDEEYYHQLIEYKQIIENEMKLVEKQIKKKNYNQEIQLLNENEYSGPIQLNEYESKNGKSYFSYKKNNILVIDLHKQFCPDKTPSDIESFKINKKDFKITYFYSYNPTIVSLEKADELVIWQPPEVNVEKRDIFIPKWWKSSLFPFIYQHRYQESSSSSIYSQDENESLNYSLRNIQQRQQFSVNSNSSESSDYDFDDCFYDNDESDDIPIIIPIPVHIEKKVYSFIVYNYWSTQSYQDLLQLNIFIT